MTSQPNHVPLLNRIFSLALALFLIGCCLVSVGTGRLYLPGSRHTQGVGHLFHGLSAMFAMLALACGAALALSGLLDHYDKRDNERSYKQFRFVISAVGWCCFVLAIVIGNITSVRPAKKDTASSPVTAVDKRLRELEAKGRQIDAQIEANNDDPGESK